ncbi:MAG: hypothetical protein PVS3B3_19760 [Ktedonobacteraceae bacterium]
MITCNNCGTVNPDIVRNCQNCMAFLPAPTGKGESGVNSRAGTQDQPVLPAWLESLRAGDRPAVQPKSFSPEDMREDSMVPSWMQKNRSHDDSSSNSNPSMRSAASPAPNTDEGYVAERNISANSLIDANALPSWMQPERPQPPQQNIAASSLVQPEFMPDWMKEMKPSSQDHPSTPVPQQNPSIQQPSFPAQGFSAQQLIDQQALPNWMRQEGSQSFTPPVQSAGPYPNQPANGPMGHAGFAASSLLDMNALPSWMREGERGAQEQRGSHPQSWQAPQPPLQRGYEQSQPWQAPQQQQPAYPPAPGGNVSGQSQRETLSMGSLIDVNALPEWLRSVADTPQSQQGQMQRADNRYTGPTTTPNYTSPPRAENVRVPSRPRGEAGTNEGSEVAANVFSSMLGVASNAPQYPAQQQQQQGYPAYPGGQAMGNIPTPSNQAQGMRVPQGTNQLGQQNYAQNAQGGNVIQQTGPGNYPMGQQQHQGMMQMQNQGEKPAKKGGLFEAIRNFFFR